MLETQERTVVMATPDCRDPPATMDHEERRVMAETLALLEDGDFLARPEPLATQVCLEDLAQWEMKALKDHQGRLED